MKTQLTIITGTSRGMGLALAEQSLGPDALVLCIARTAQAGLPAKADAAGATLLQWQADLANPAPVAKRLHDWLAALPAATLASATLINNAGVIPPLRPLRDSEDAELAQALRVGLEAPLLLSRAFLAATRDWPALPRKILNVSSGLGRRAMAASSAYCAAKAGMDHFSRCVALEEAALPHGARLCALAPGVIDTAMQVQLRGANPADFADQPGFAALHAKGQLTDPAEAARRLLAFLARPDFGAEPVADIRTLAARS